MGSSISNRRKQESPTLTWSHLIQRLKHQHPDVVQRLIPIHIPSIGWGHRIQWIESDIQPLDLQVRCFDMDTLVWPARWDQAETHSLLHLSNGGGTGKGVKLGSGLRYTRPSVKVLLVATPHLILRVIKEAR